MWAKHPEIARRWAEEGKGYVVKKKGSAKKPKPVKRPVKSKGTKKVSGY
jgi:hypothetical protein